MMANGTSGDVNNVDFRASRGKKQPYAQMHHVARDVARKVSDALASVIWNDSAALDSRYREVPLSWRKIDAELLAWAEEKNKGAQATSKADLPTIYADRVTRLAQAKDPAIAPLQVFRIGDIAVATSPCETFAEMGMEFKKRSPLARSFMVELGHAYMGYLPTPRHFALGGYETWPGTNSLETQASEKILNNLLEMTSELSTPKK